MVVLPIGPRNNTASLLVDSTKSHACWLAGSRAQFLLTEGDRTTTTTQKWKQKHSYNCHCWSEMLYCHLMATSKSLQITFQFENILWNEKRSCKMPFFSFICCWTNSSEWACEHDLSLLCCVVLLKNRHCAEHGFFFLFLLHRQSNHHFSFIILARKYPARGCLLLFAFVHCVGFYSSSHSTSCTRAKWKSTFTLAKMKFALLCRVIDFTPLYSNFLLSDDDRYFESFIDFSIFTHAAQMNILHTNTQKRGKTHKYTQKMPKYSVISDFSFHFVSGSEWRGKGISVNGR